jgi:ubiquinone/menaquinone biosynthesis C-methylase UbiE
MTAAHAPVKRGKVGLLPRTPRLEDQSYIEFQQSLRNFAIGKMFPQVAVNAAAATQVPAGTAPLPRRQFVQRVDALPEVVTWKRIMRSQQQHTWWKLYDSFQANAAHYQRELLEAERARPNRLHYRPDFVVPEYAKCEIHLQPGGYVADPLAGYVFHHGTKVFYQGLNDQDELHREVVSHVAPPADGLVRRVLDVGCSIGQCTTALKQRFPNAEVTGLDVALPLLRYAHKRAVDLNIDVHFRQGLAEDTKLEAGAYDVVLAYILFHEVPAKLFVPILREFARLLRPGGMLTIVDAPNAREFPAGNRLWLEFDANYNCEPYSPAFVASDLPAMLAQAGLKPVTSGPTQTFLQFTTALKPAAA